MSNDTRDFYKRVAPLYDHVGPYRERPDVQFFVDEAVASGGPVLELGCGTGRVLIPTARAGIEIVGLDASEAMLDVCRGSVAKEGDEVGAHVTLVDGDMCDFDLGRKFALITLPFRPFQHLHEIDDQIRCLECVHSHLGDGGRLILDLFNPMHERLTDDAVNAEYQEEPAGTLPDGSVMIRSGRTVAVDRALQLLEVEMLHDITRPDGSREQIVERIHLRYFFRYEVEHLLARCDFEVEALYSDYDRRPFGDVYPSELLYIARKA